MPPVSRRTISPKTTKNIYDLLIQSFSKAKGKNEIIPFISDLLTPTEQIMISKRLAIAFLLLRKDYGQRQIAMTLKVSTATVARVNLILNTQGAGYRRILSRVLKDENLKVLLNEIFETFTPLPQKGVNWGEWKKNRRIRKQNLKSF